MSQSDTKQLKNQVQSIVEDLRGDMSPQYFYGYVSGLMLYKHLSDNLEALFAEILLENSYTITLNQLDERVADYQKIMLNLKEKSIENIGYYLEPKYLFSNMIKRSGSYKNIFILVYTALWQIESSSKRGPLNGSLDGIFEDVDLNWNRFGNKNPDKNALTKGLLERINVLKWTFPETLKSITDQKHYLDGLLSFTESQILDPADVDTPADSIFMNGHEYALKV